MYIYTNIKIQRNIHIPKTPSSHPNVETQQLTHIHNVNLHKRNEVGIPYPLLSNANEADSAYVCDSKRVHSMHWKKINIKHRMECQ